MSRRLRWPLGWVAVTRFEWARRGYGTFTFYYAAKGGGPMLIEDVRWWHINGFLLQHKGFNVGVVFCRHAEGS